MFQGSGQVHQASSGSENVSEALWIFQIHRRPVVVMSQHKLLPNTSVLWKKMLSSRRRLGFLLGGEWFRARLWKKLPAKSILHLTSMDTDIWTPPTVRQVTPPLYKVKTRKKTSTYTVYLFMIIYKTLPIGRWRVIPCWWFIFASAKLNQTKLTFWWQH